MKKTFLIIFLCLLFVPFVDASLLGVNRISVDYTDVLRSGYAEDYVVVSTGSLDNVSLYLEAQGDIKDWISFEPNENGSITMNANTPAVIKIIVQPPADARSEDYSGTILIATGPLGEQSGKIGTNVVVAFELKINVKVTDTQTLACGAGGFDIKDAEIGYPLEFAASVNNNGNVRAKPSFNIKIYDKDQKEIVAVLNYTSSKEILPTMSDTINAKLEHSLDVGQYWAEINSSPCGSGGLLTFSILEKGGISDVGEFVRLDNNAWAVTGDIVPIDAYFRNRGTRMVSAQFKGIVTLEGKIVKVVSSDKVDVVPGELVPLRVFFTPEEMGQYKISGRINYNNKITFEKSSMLNVEQGTGKSSKINVYYIALITIIIVIILLLLMIIRKKKRKQHKEHK
jgi:hypothetical protein